MAGDISQLLEQPETDQDQATKTPLSADGKPNLVMRPVPRQQQTNIASAPQEVEAPKVNIAAAPLPSGIVDQKPALPSTAGIPNIARDNKVIPGTLHQDASGQLSQTPFNYQQRLNPMLGMFAKSENISNPALRTLSRIATGFGSVANSIASGMSGETDERAKEIAAADKEAEDTQQMKIRGQEENRRLTAEDLIQDAAGNVIGYKQNGQLHGLEGAPKEVQDLASATTPKGGFNIKDVNLIGADGKPQSVSVMVDEAKLRQLSGTDDFKNAPDKTAYLEANGAIHRMNLGQAAPSGAASRPQYHMVPTGSGMEQLAMMNPTDPTHPTMIGQPQKVGSTKLLTMVNPNDPNDVQFFQQDSKTGGISPVNNIPKGMVTPQIAGQDQHRTDAFNKDWETPAQQIERSYQLFSEAKKAFDSGDAKTGAASMLALSQHLGTTFGQIKGSRMNKDLIMEHKDAIGISDKIERYYNQLATGQQLSTNQMKEFGDLITNMRNLTFQTTTFEAARRHVPIDFLPADAKIKMQDSKGTVREVRGNQVAGLVEKGAKVAQ